MKFGKGYFCPIVLGQALLSRYRILSLLGWGGFAIVWLAVDLAPGSVHSWKHDRFFADQKQAHPTHRNTSRSKFSAASRIRLMNTPATRSSVCESLCKVGSATGRAGGTSSSYLTLSTSSPPNGIHRFLVLEVAGLHFAELTVSEGYDFDDAVYLFKQCIETVEYVHSMGISHGGMFVLSPALCVVEADFRGRP